MQSNLDWLPGRRADQLVMCKNWISIMSPAELRARWDITVNQSTLRGGLVHRTFTAAARA
jgi:hypothetical protein